MRSKARRPSSSSSPRSASARMSTGSWSKWSWIDSLPRPVTNTTRSMPASASSSTTCCTTGLPPTGSISLGWDFVAGSSRVPRPATGRRRCHGRDAMLRTGGTRRALVDQRPDAAISCRDRGEIAQLVEHTTENRGVPGSSPGLAIAALAASVLDPGTASGPVRVRVSPRLIPSPPASVPKLATPTAGVGQGVGILRWRSQVDRLGRASPRVTHGVTSRTVATPGADVRRDGGGRISVAAALSRA